MSDARFIGTWRQIRPDPAPAHITLVFQDGGAMTYILTMRDEQRIALQWRVEGDMLITMRNGEESASQFRFASLTMFVLERDGEHYVYRRDA